MLMQSLYRPGEALWVTTGESPRFQDNWHMKAVRFPALRTSQEIFLALISVEG